MPLTNIDTTPALIVIDLQKGIVAMPTVHPIAEIVSRVVALAKAFRHRGWPVVLVNVTASAPGRTDANPSKVARPADWAELVAELDPAPSDYRISKQRVGAFIGTKLDAELRGRAVTQVFMTGVATSLGVESTARSAFDLGYNVVFVVDAMTDRDPESHNRSIEKTFPRLGETESAANVLKAIETL